MLEYDPIEFIWTHHYESTLVVSSRGGNGLQLDIVSCIRAHKPATWSPWRPKNVLPCTVCFWCMFSRCVLMYVFPCVFWCMFFPVCFPCMFVCMFSQYVLMSCFPAQYVFDVVLFVCLFGLGLGRCCCFVLFVYILSRNVLGGAYVSYFSKSHHVWNIYFPKSILLVMRGVKELPLTW